MHKQNPFKTIFMRYFNTSGPNNSEKHYTLKRKQLNREGIRLVKDLRYFTVWAPRQTGKSTWFRQLAIELEKDEYQVAHINFENYRKAPLWSFMNTLVGDMNKFWKTKLPNTTIDDVFYQLESITNKNLVLIIDEVEGINPEYFGDFLLAIRKVYHTRENHCLKSVILVGVSNITGIVRDNASPFNIADNFAVPYFTNEESFELLEQHETETSQLFDAKVKTKISEITANQPGLVNGFANRLVTTNPDKKLLTYEDYLKVENWYLTKVIDKNVANVVKVAEQHRQFVERLLFIEEKIKFTIGRPAIEVLHTNGLITWDENDYVKFWVPLYQKKLFDVFYPYSNGETGIIMRSMPYYEIVDEQGNFNIKRLIGSFKVYIKKRSFRPFREKDKEGNYKSIKEAVIVYSFETYIHAFLEMVGAKSYREAQVALGNTDLIINDAGKEYLIETKIYRYDKQFQNGKKQLGYYANRLGIKEAIYLVFVPNNIQHPEKAKENKETHHGISVQTFLVFYDEEKDF